MVLTTSRRVDDDDDDDESGYVLHVIDIQSGDILQSARFELKGAAPLQSLRTATRSTTTSLASVLTRSVRSWCSSSPSRGPRRDREARVADLLTLCRWSLVGRLHPALAPLG